MENLMILLGGILLGWITKTPFLLKMYKKQKEENAHIRTLLAKMNEMWHLKTQNSVAKEKLEEERIRMFSNQSDLNKIAIKQLLPDHEIEGGVEGDDFVLYVYPTKLPEGVAWKGEPTKEDLKSWGYIVTERIEDSVSSEETICRAYTHMLEMIPEPINARMMP